MIPCRRPGCRGVIDEDGFCDTCLLEALPSGTVADMAPDESSFQSADTLVPDRREPAEAHGAWGAGPREDGVRMSRSASSAAAAAVAGSPFWGAFLMDLPLTQTRPPTDALQSNPTVPTVRRRCRTCGTRVGYSHDGQPALDRGVCHKCETPFSYLPSLTVGDVVDERYEVAGCIGYGGLGWVYLAYDLNLERRPVALKGLINGGDAAAVETAVRERHFLIRVWHGNLVRIHDFATRPPTAGGTEPEGYIVMEFVPGFTWQHRPPATLEHLLRATLEVLGALDYLHGSGILFCDFKPENVMFADDGVKLIDLGAARTVDDHTSRVLYTPLFAAPEVVAGAMPTVASDLYTVGAALDRLEPPTTGQPADGVASFKALVARATMDQPGKRFASAAQMAGQVSGVLRELLGPRPGAPSQLPSLEFAPSPVLLDGGLGTVPPLERWLTASARRSAAEGRWAPLDDGRPGAALIAAALPYPAGSAQDPAAGFVATVSLDPAEAAAQLEGFSGFSPDVELLRCRALLAAGHRDHADRVLARVRTAEPEDWRIGWYQSLIDAADGDYDDAEKGFEAVRAALPGELAPRLAIGLCAEHRGDLAKAESHYGTVWRTDRGYAGAAFGLARISMRRGGRAAAISALDDIPETSLHRATARTAAIRVFAGRIAADQAAAEPGGAGPAYPDLAAAVARLKDERLGGGDADGGGDHARLTVLVKEALLEWARRERESIESGRLTTDAVTLFGCRPTERELRGLVERAVRGLAGHEPDRHRRTILVDLANAVRPRAAWSW